MTSIRHTHTAIKRILLSDKKKAKSRERGLSVSATVPYIWAREGELSVVSFLTFSRKIRRRCCLHCGGCAVTDGQHRLCPKMTTLPPVVVVAAGHENDGTGRRDDYYGPAVIPTDTTGRRPQLPLPAVATPLLPLTPMQPPSSPLSGEGGRGCDDSSHEDEQDWKEYHVHFHHHHRQQKQHHGDDAADTGGGAISQRLHPFKAQTVKDGEEDHNDSYDDDEDFIRHVAHTMFDRRAQEAGEYCDGEHGDNDDDGGNDDDDTTNIQRNTQHARGYFDTYHYTLVPKNMEQCNNDGERSGEIEENGKDEMKGMTMTLHGFSDDEKKIDVKKASVAAAAVSVDTISLRYRVETANSTGLGVWAGAELLARFLVERCPHGKHLRHPRDLHERADPTDPASIPCVATSAAAVVPFPLSLQNRHCVELGAGVGLCGLVAHIWLGAKHVTSTDGDSVVLRNLRHNVRMNCVADNNNSSGRGRIGCRQLIWGRRRAVQFLKDYHRHLDQSATAAAGDASVRDSVSGLSGGRRRNVIQVVMASDCIYMVPSVVPFWETVATLLSPTIPDDSIDGECVGAYGDNEDDGINDDKIFIYVNVAASQAPLAKVLQTAMDHGLEWQEEQVPPSQVYIFRRRRGGTDQATEDCAPHIPAGPPDAAAPCSDSGTRLSSYPMMYPHDDVTASNANSRPQNMHSHHRLRRN